MGWKLIKDYKYLIGGGKTRMLDTLRALKQKTSYSIKPLKPVAPKGYKYEWQSDRGAKPFTPSNSQISPQAQTTKDSSIWFKK